MFGSRVTGRWAYGLVCCMVAVWVGQTHAAGEFDAAAHFAGKTIVIMVPLSAGGAVDIEARQLAAVLPRHLPGSPSVVVENRAGGGGMAGMNWLYAAAPADGTYFAYAGSSAFTAPLFDGGSDATYDLSRMPIIGGLAAPNVAYAHRHSVPEATALHGKQPVFAGMFALNSALSIELLNGLSALEGDVRAVRYPGGPSETRAATLRGEVDVAIEGFTAYVNAIREEVDAGLLIPVWQTGIFQGDEIVRFSAIDEVPTFLELYEQATGNPLSGDALTLHEWSVAARSMGRGIILPANVPETVVDTLQEAVWSAMNDPEWLETLNMDASQLVPGDAARSQAQRVLSLSTELIELHTTRWEASLSR